MLIPIVLFVIGYNRYEGIVDPLTNKIVIKTTDKVINGFKFMGSAFALVVLLGMIGAMFSGTNPLMFFMFGGQMIGEMIGLLFKILSELIPK